MAEGCAVNVAISDWTSRQDLNPHQKMSKIILAIITNSTNAGNNSLDQLRTMLDSGWDVNMLLSTFNEVHHKWVHRTALQEAAKLVWTDGVKMLLDAGAKLTTRDALQNPLALALQNHNCQPHLVELLLKHGADPNDRDNQHNNIPLLNAVVNQWNQENGPLIVSLLLEYGADPDVTHRVDTGRGRNSRWVQRTALHEAITRGWTEGVRTLLDAGAKSTMSDLSSESTDVNPSDQTEFVNKLSIVSVHPVQQIRVSAVPISAGTKRVLQNPLALALQDHNCQIDLIKLLLKHGADPNDHDGQNIPLLNAIINQRNSGPILVKLLLDHGADPNVTHRVCHSVGRWRKSAGRNALYEAVRLGQTEVAKLLNDAGAKWAALDVQSHYKELLNPLALALQNDCPPELIELLLNNGADPNHHNTAKDIPLCCAISNIRDDLHLARIFQLLLEHGAKPDLVYRVKNESSRWVHRTALHDAAMRGWTEGVKILLSAGGKCNDTASSSLENPLAPALQSPDCPPDVIDLLLKRTRDVNCIVLKGGPLLHKLSRYIFRGDAIFLHQQLDFVFLHGGNINMEDSDHRTALEYAVKKGCHSNNVRWLIRHGADKLPAFSLLRGHFMLYRKICLPDTPLILLQAGMRVSHGAQAQLSNMELVISAWLEEDSGDDRNMLTTVQSLWDQLERSEELETVQSNLKKTTFLKYLPRQMVDLQEFCDESLQSYPEDTPTSPADDNRQEYQNISNLIHRVLEFVGQPQSLLWHCRRCMRENLVSLQPSVVKSLPGPSGLKRYILCHEV